MKIFVNNVFFNLLKPGETAVNGVIIPITNADEIIRLYEQVTNAQVHTTVQYNFLPDNYEKIKEQIKSHFQIIYAAGGLVTKGDQILFIKRLGKWDLPKGKVDKGEDRKAAALREVWEECGIKAKLIRKIANVWHTYTQNKINTLKKTTWYEMICLDDTNMRPQSEEDITKVKWATPEDRAKMLSNTYAAIIYVVNKWAETTASEKKSPDNQQLK
ncbi:MAG: NUDIX domain-containing protein [Cytophagales bacterium]|nr:NUDIX domain-containing protein [Bernardetiaceae bacterium]MDW8205916.1 NUDIX domain-containing protein [Cytophagales bacterium]